MPLMAAIFSSGVRRRRATEPKLLQQALAVLGDAGAVVEDGFFDAAFQRSWW